jgi:adenosylcobinamide-phosphate synthase
MARLIAWGDEAWNSEHDSDVQQRLQGVALLLLLLAASLIAGLLITRLCFLILPWVVAIIVLAVLASALIAQRSLHAHVVAVAEALEKRGVEGGREAVSQIVGRDTNRLDEAAISRAAIESLAESFCDGIVAPLFWLALAGLPGVLAYKAINTADSMIGHKTPRYLAFGWAAARTDDLVNLPAARLAALWLVAAAVGRAGLSPRRALATAMRDARRHQSPNAGWPEAAMAGALGIRLGGPRGYDGEMVDGAWLGDGRAEATARDIRTALDLYRRACAVQLMVLALLALITLGVTSI